MDKINYFRTLDRNRRRAEELSFIFSRIPVDDDHEAFMRQQENKGKEHLAQQEFASNVYPSSPPGERDKRPLNSQFQDNRSFSCWTASARPDLMDLRQGDDESSTYFSDGNNTGEILPKNMRRIPLLFENKRHLQLEVLLDSGTAGNWISERIVKGKGIPWDIDEGDKEYEDVNGRTVKSCGIVYAQWSFKGQTREAKFKIARGSTASWEVIFGYQCLLRNGVMTFHRDKSDRLVAPLISRNRKPTAMEKQQIKRNEEGSKTLSSKIHDFLEWKQEMTDAGWQWDKEQSKFYKVTEHGGKEWCKDGCSWTEGWN